MRRPCLLGLVAAACLLVAPCAVAQPTVLRAQLGARAGVRLPAGTTAVLLRWHGQRAARVGVTLLDGRGRALWRTRVGADADAPAGRTTDSELVTTPGARALRLSGHLRGRVALLAVDGRGSGAPAAAPVA